MFLGKPHRLIITVPAACSFTSQCENTLATLTSSATMSDIVWYDGSVTPATCGVTITFGCCACVPPTADGGGGTHTHSKERTGATHSKIRPDFPRAAAAHHRVVRGKRLLPHHVRRDAPKPAPFQRLQSGRTSALSNIAASKICNMRSK